MMKRRDSNRRQLVTLIAAAFVLSWCIVVLYTQSTVVILNGNHHPYDGNMPLVPQQRRQRIVHERPSVGNQLGGDGEGGGGVLPDSGGEREALSLLSETAKRQELKALSPSSSSFMKANVKKDPYYGWQADLSTTNDGGGDDDCSSIRQCFETEHAKCASTCRDGEEQMGEVPNTMNNSISKDWIPNPHMLHQMYLDGKDFNGNPFPPTLPDEYCEEISSSGRKNNDINKELLDTVPIQALKDPNGTADMQELPTLFCGVYTMYEKHHTNVRAMRDTWAPLCNGFVAFSTISDPRIPSYKIEHEGKEEYSNMWQKSRSIWKFIHDNYIDEGFDYFILGGEDLFVIPTNLRAYLQSLKLDPSKDDLFAGRRFKADGKDNYFNSGGAGYVLSKATLKKYITEGYDHPKCNPDRHTSMEDVMIAQCLRNAFQIGLTDTRDSFGRERFHPFSPGQHLTWQPPSKGQRDWYANYNKEWGIKLGKDCCAPDSVSFHYLKKPAMVRHLYSLLYLCSK